MGGGGGGGGPTVQQQQLQAQQAMTTANLNLEENAQRKTILNSMQGTRVFRGSALSRALRGNTNQPGAAGGPSQAQISASTATPTVISPVSLLDGRVSIAQPASTGISAAAGLKTSGGFYGGISAPNSRKLA